MDVDKRIEDLISDYKLNKQKDVEVEMKIILAEEKTIYSNPRRLPPPDEDFVNRQIDEWLEADVIESSCSDFSSPVVVVRKKDGGKRLCIDYRGINKIVIKDRYPIPVIEDLIDQLQEASIFSTLDLKNGFLHVSVEQNSRRYTSFVIPNGQYQFKRMPFGICNSPSVFQRYINTIFRTLLREKKIMIYLDDVIIPSRTEEEGLEILKEVLNTASEYGLELNFKKCSFLKKRIEFLGHVIEHGKAYPSPTKIKAVVHFPQPKNTKEVQRFLGLAGYFRKFIQGYSIIARPLSELLKKDVQFSFSVKQKKSFNLLKEALTKEPVLKLYNRRLETELHTDASIDGYGAILLQKDEETKKFHPVYFMSKKTSEAERRYTSYELEVLAIVTALKKFKNYLLGIEFKIFTDCAAFEKTMQKRDLPPKVARWALLLQEYNYRLEHRPGIRMRHVDALSRGAIMTVDIDDGLLKRIQQVQMKDEWISCQMKIIKYEPSDEFISKGDLLYKFQEGAELLVLPKSLQNEVIRTFHEKAHSPVNCTEAEIKQQFFFTKMHQKLENIVRNCIKCTLVNRKGGKQEGFLNPIPKEDIPLHTYHIDHLGPLDSTHKYYNHILCLIDAFSKFVWLYPTKSTTTKEVLDRLNIQKKTFGNPAKMIADRGSAFRSEEFKDYCKSEDIELHRITTGVLRSNGQIERINRSIIPILSKLSINDPTKWYRYIDKVQQTLNSRYHRSLKYSPFDILFGTKMRQPEDLKLKELVDEAIMEDFAEKRDSLRQEAKEQILKVQEENKKTYNLRRPATQYQLSQLVAIKKTQQGPGQKLRSKFMGPYRVTKVKPKDTYDVTREGFHEGLLHTTTCAEYMKPWIPYDDDSSYSSGPDEYQDGRTVGSNFPLGRTVENVLDCPTKTQKVEGRRK